jgi:hypothetical protein
MREPPARFEVEDRLEATWKPMSLHEEYKSLALEELLAEVAIRDT